MRTSAARATAVLSLALIGAAVPSGAFAARPAAPSSSGITLAPAHSVTGQAQTCSYFLRSLPAGGRYSDAVAVSNGSGAAVTLNVMPVDGITAAGTGADYGDKAATGDGRWITPATTKVVVPAHSTVLEHFTLRVPRGARPGDHLAGLAFVNPTAKSSTRGALTIRTTYRNVMGVETQVAGPAASRFRLTGQQLGAGVGTGLATATIELANIGRLLDKGTLQVTLRGHNYSRTATRALGMILPGTSVRLPISWPTALRAGTYTMTTTFSGTDFSTARLVTTQSMASPLPGGPNAAIHPFSTSPVQTGTAPGATRPFANSGAASTRPASTDHGRNTALVVAGGVAGGLALLVALAMAFVAGSRRRDEAAQTTPVASDDKQLVDA